MNTKLIVCQREGTYCRGRQKKPPCCWNRIAHHQRAPEINHFISPDNSSGEPLIKSPFDCPVVVHKVLHNGRIEKNKHNSNIDRSHSQFTICKEQEWSRVYLRDGPIKRYHHQSGFTSMLLPMDLMSLLHGLEPLLDLWRRRERRRFHNKFHFNRS